MSEKRLLSIAQIARQIDVPESTLHYWKNRFGQYLPSVGKKRQKRFKPEAVETFQLISALLRDGHTVDEVMAELSKRYPVNADTVSELPVSQSGGSPACATASGASVEQVAHIAAAIGTEIARSISEGLKNLATPQAALPSGMNNEELAALKERLEEAGALLGCQNEDMDTLKQENEELKGKLSILEAELVRLRKDRREMERFLLEKIKKSAK